MRKSMNDWSDEINDMGSAGRKQMINALKDLDSWNFFKEAFDGYGLNHILHMLETVEKTYQAEQLAEELTSDLDDEPKDYHKNPSYDGEVYDIIQKTKRIANGEGDFEGYTRAELNEAFNKVINPKDWKAPIFARVWLKKLDVTIAAIRFYTATEPTVERFPGRDDATVTSEGYRKGPAGDH